VDLFIVTSLDETLSSSWDSCCRSQTKTPAPSQNQTQNPQQNPGRIRAPHSGACSDPPPWGLCPRLCSRTSQWTPASTLRTSSTG